MTHGMLLALALAVSLGLGLQVTIPERVQRKSLTKETGRERGKADVP